MIRLYFLDHALGIAQLFRSRNIALMAVFVGLFSACGFAQGTQQQNGNSLANPNAIAILRWYSANLAASFQTGSAPAGIAFDGQNLWIANAYSNNVTKLRANDGSPLGTFAVGDWPCGVAFDGENIWVTNET